MTSTTNTARRAGFTLIELTAALFILTVGILGVIQMFHYGIAKMHAVNENAIVVRALQNEIETLRSLPFDELIEVRDAPFRSVTPELGKLVNTRALVTIETEPDNARLQRVTASVAWSGEHGRTIRKSLTTLIADKGGR